MKMSLTVVDLLLSSIMIILFVGVRGWTSDGTNFIIACPSLQTASPTVDCTLHVMGSEGVQVNVTGTMPGLPITETISSALLMRITLQGDYLIAQLLVITTSDVVSIFVENQAQGGPSLYLAIPLSVDLTQPVETFLMSFPISSPELNVFIVGSAYAGNRVTLTAKSTGAFIYNTVTYNDGGTLVVTLQAGEVLEIITEQDLTGTHVEATKPVGVFTGTKVQPTLEQVPLLSQWESVTALPYFDLCNNITVRTLVSQDNTNITLNRKSGRLEEARNKGEYYDHGNNGTASVLSTASLVGMRCTIGPDDHPFVMLLPPVSGLGKEFKCLTLSGNNTVYMISEVKTDTNYNVSDTDTLFTNIDYYDGVGVSTMRASVPDGYLIIKSKDSSVMEPYIAGFKSHGAYGYACAQGTMGSLLPDPSNSLVDVVLVYTPLPALESSTSTADSFSGVIISSTTEPLSSSMTSRYITMTSSSEQMPESNGLSLAPTSSKDVITSAHSSSDINIASTTEVLSPFLASSYLDMTTSSEQMPVSSTFSVAPASSGDVITSAHSSSDVNTASTTEALPPSLTSNYIAMMSSSEQMPVPSTSSRDVVTSAHSSSGVNIATTTGPLSPSLTSSHFTITSSSEQVPESSIFHVAPTSSGDFATSADSYSDVNIVSTTEPLSTSTLSYKTMTSSSEQMPEPSTFSLTLSSNGVVGTSTDSSVVTSNSIVPSNTIYTTSSTTDTSSSETSTALSTVTVPPTHAASQIKELCFCRCGENDILSNEIKAFLEKFDMEIKRNLTLDSKTLSAYIRSKTSAKDDRPSAQNVGYFGIIIICVTGCLLVFADVLSLFKIGNPKPKKVVTSEARKKQKI